ncbi:UPF0547 protein C16orf87 homolog [Rhopilema esculentum]|uniref:UPF0547 protein C16orf87 homolog n=1 Tax=Rhopilema esculentum TaxID=499914 RepID=UPI0031E28EFC
MVVKHCPSCNNTLAVACKTCPACGYVFQAKKPLTAKSSDRKPVVLGERLRPERSKKEVQKGNDYLYHNATVHGGDLKKETEVVLTSTDSLMDYQHQARKQAKTESVKATVSASIRCPKC